MTTPQDTDPILHKQIYGNVVLKLAITLPILQALAPVTAYFVI